MPDTVRRPLRLSDQNPRAFGWWGVMTIIMTEGALFAYLLFSYYYFAVQYGSSFLPDELPRFRLSLPNTIILLASSAVMWWTEREGARGEGEKRKIGLAATVVLGVIFVVIQWLEWKSKPFTLSSGAYGSLYFTITGFHMAHVIAGLIALVVLLAWSVRAKPGAAENSAVSIGAAYWHFVDAVWVTVFLTLYVTPYLG